MFITYLRPFIASQKTNSRVTLKLLKKKECPPIISTFSYNGLYKAHSFNSFRLDRGRRFTRLLQPLKSILLSSVRSLSGLQSARAPPPATLSEFNRSSSLNGVRSVSLIEPLKSRVLRDFNFLRGFKSTTSFLQQLRASL